MALDEGVYGSCVDNIGGLEVKCVIMYPSGDTMLRMECVGVREVNIREGNWPRFVSLGLHVLRLAMQVVFDNSMHWLCQFVGVTLCCKDFVMPRIAGHPGPELVWLICLSL